MCRATITQNIDDISDDCNDPAHFRSCNGGAPLRFAFVLISCIVRARKIAAGEFIAALETYEILTSGRPIRNRKLTRVSAKDGASKEAIMLDIAFVALGLAVLALMGVYALALSQL
jgi:hypothetical protein